MSINMKTLTQALAKTANVIEKTIQTTVNEVTGPRALQDYTILHQIGSGGPANIWKLYSARPSASAPSTQYPLVCVWILDKKSLSESRIKAGLSKAAEDGFLDVVRADVGRMVRIRHPGVVHVVSGLDEGKNSMVVVTEPLFASVGNALGYLHNIENVPKELKGMEMGLLEVKHGLLQVAETLDFLHSNARLVHRSISPETVFITSSGAWKLGGFGFAITVDEASSASMQPFHYPEYDVEDEILPLQPSLNYTAPELVRSKSQVAGSSSDVFSFGCLAYHLIARKPLLDCHNNVKMYMNTLAYLSSDAFSMIPSELVRDLQRMLSMDAASRPTAMDFTGSSFFRNDSRLRALRFLDHMLERDNMQKSEFLKALSDMWKDFDSRVLRYKVLPPLCAELRNLVMQPMILPMVLTIAESQDKSEFELATLPALVPVLTSASGDTLLLLVKHADLIINKEDVHQYNRHNFNYHKLFAWRNKASQDHLITHVLPMLVRAYDDSDARMQEEVLRRTVPLARQLDMQLVKQAILPRVHSLALRTTVAAVRVNALRCLGDLVSSLDKHAILEILQTIQRCTAVDRSAPTLMCTLGVANAIFKQCGVEFTSEHVLPLLFPLLTSQQLNVQQFSKFMLFVRDILRKIEEKRGVTITDAHVEIKPTPAPSLNNGLHSDPVHRASIADSSSTKSNKSWDEDWGTITKGTPAPSVPINSVQPQPIQSSLPSLVSSSSSTSCAPVNIEWPSSLVSSNTNINHSNLEDKSKQSLDFTSNSSSGFDDLDPFANWPPKPSITTSGSNMNNFNFTSNSSTAMNTNMNMRSTQSNPSSNSMVGGMRYTNTMNNSSRKGGDIGSVFTSTNGGNPTPRLAPPPSSAIGRGGPIGGRGRGARSNNNAKASNQPPLLDLL